MRLRRILSSSGDTLVEVMLSMTVLAMVVAAAYTTSIHSFHTSIDSQYRDQAISYAQQQVELLKNADAAGSAVIDSYKQVTPYCIRPTDLSKQSGNNCQQALGGWGSSGIPDFSINTVYTGNTSKTFKVTVGWQDASGHNQQSVVYYKASASFVDSGSTPPLTDLTTPPPPPEISNFKANPAAVTYNGYSNLSWDSAYATSCAATAGPWNGSKPLSNPVGGAAGDVGPLTDAPSTFTLTCKGIDTSVTASRQAQVKVGAAPVPTVQTLATSFVYPSYAYLHGSVNPNGLATTYYFQYGTTDSYGYTTSSASAGSGTDPVYEYTYVGGLNETTTYHYRICATNIGGTNCGADLTLTTPSLPKIDSFYASPNPLGYSGASTIYWSSSYTTGCYSPQFGWVGTSGSASTGKLYTDTSYSLTCYNSSGYWTGYAYLTVTVRLPSLDSFYASPSSVIYSSGTTLYWTSSSTAGCYSPQFGWVGANSSYWTGPLYANTTYSLACYNAASYWTGYAYASVTVSGAPSVTSFYASPSTIIEGGTSTIYWNSVNTTGCYSPQFGWVGTSGNRGTGNLYTSTSYSLACYNAASYWTGYASLTVTVKPPSLDSFYASPTAISYSGASTLYWSSAYTSGCYSPQFGYVGTSGSLSTGKLYADTTYSLACYNAAGIWTGYAYAGVTVSGPPSVTSFYASPTSVVYAGGSTLYWNSTNTAGCYSPQFGWVGTNSSYWTGALYSSTTFSLACYNAASYWTGYAYASVTVSAVPSVTSFYASPSSVVYGSGTTLYWASSNTAGCYSPQFGWVGANSSYWTGALYSSTTYSLACYNAANYWSGYAYAAVSVTSPPAISYFYASPNPTPYGSGTSLYWNSTNTAGCYSPQFGWVGTSGIRSTGALYSNTSYSLECYNSSGYWTGYSTTTVYIGPTVTYFYASPNPINYGGGTYLYFGSAYATNCWSPQFGWIGTSGYLWTGALYSNTTYGLYCYNGNYGWWSGESLATVYIAATITYFYASPSSISYGDPTTLYFGSAYATNCWSPQFGWIGTSGSVSTGLVYSNTTYGLYCYNPSWGWSPEATTNVYVGPSGIYGYYYQGADFNYGGWGPYNDGTINWCSDVNGCNNGWLPTLRARTYLSEASCASVYWVGQVYADAAGYYYFGTVSDDGIRVLLNGNTWEIYNWSQHSWTWNQGGGTYLTPGWWSFQVWYQNNNGNGCWTGNDYSADAIVEWSTPTSGGWQVIPQNHMRPY